MDLLRAREIGRAVLTTLEANRRRLDDLNVYPVPDGDTGTNLTLTVRDDGRGLPAAFNLGTTSSLGLQLVSDLTDQLGGTVTVGRQGGTAFLIRIPRSYRVLR